jgi:hypothetical protein
MILSVVFLVLKELSFVEKGSFPVCLRLVSTAQASLVIVAGYLAVSSLLPTPVAHLGYRKRFRV